jgi:hypothetical protein
MFIAIGGEVQRLCNLMVLHKEAFNVSAATVAVHRGWGQRGFGLKNRSTGRYDTCKNLQEMCWSV